MVLDHVEAQRHHEIGIVDRERHAVLASQSDGVKAVLGTHIDTALGHESADHADAGSLTKEPELLAARLRIAPLPERMSGPLPYSAAVESCWSC